MRIAHLECVSGVSGDMFLGALLDAGADLEAVRAAVASLGLPAVRLETEEVRRAGFRGLKLHVRGAEEPSDVHRHLSDVAAMIDGAALTDRARRLASAVFTRLAEAEARVHGVTVEEVHFHEVGAVDSLADVVGSVVAFDQLGIASLTCSPVPTGRGVIRIAHGRTAIPAPATADLLRGVPLAPSDVEAELTTPTGAALVTTLATGFGPPPAMIVERIGSGAGTRDFPTVANLLRIAVGTSVAAAVATPDPSRETIVVLETNLDDVPGERIGFALERLLAAGALDATVAPVLMKKGRPGVIVTVLCRPADADRIETLLFSETGTLGVRRREETRRVLPRRTATVETAWGPIRGKVATTLAGEEFFSAEYEACREAALRCGVPLRAVEAAAEAAFAATR